MMTDKSARGMETLNRIVEAAIPLFARHGLRGTTVRHVCAAAGVNVASVNYYFRSKEGLYRAVHERVFPDMTKPLLALPATVHDAASWETALTAWVDMALGFTTREDPPYVWASQLYAHERAAPSSVFPYLYENMYRPIEHSLIALIRMGLPANAPADEVKRWTSTTIAQCSYFSQRSGPWHDLILPKDLPPEEWRRRMTAHIVKGITARLKFTTPVTVA